MSKRKSKTTIGPIEFIHRIIKRDEKGEPFTLAASAVRPGNGAQT